MTTEEVIANSVIGLVTGFATSVLTLMGDRWLRKCELRSLHKRMNGRYKLHPEGGLEATDELVNVQYIGDGNVRIESTGPKYSWTSIIHMSDANPLHGEGVFNYDKKHDWGVHSLHYNTADGSIAVLVKQVIHRPEYNTWYVLVKV